MRKHQTSWRQYAEAQNGTRIWRRYLLGFRKRRAKSLASLLPVVNGHTPFEQRGVEAGEQLAGCRRLVLSRAAEHENFDAITPPKPNLGHLKTPIHFQFVDAAARQCDLQRQIRKLFFLPDAPGFVRLGARSSHFEAHRGLAARHDLDALLKE